MRLSIDIPCRPATLNSATRFSKRGAYKSNAAKVFASVFNETLTEDQNTAVESFGLHYATIGNPCIIAGYTVNLEGLLTRNGFISKTSGDLENLTKYATDLLFKEIKKTFSGCDDSQIIALYSNKALGENGIRIDLESMELDEYLKKEKYL